MTKVAEREWRAQQYRIEISEFLSQFVDDPAQLDRPGLITRRLFDSMVAVQLIGFVEERYGIEVDNDDLEVENFDSLDNLVAFVLDKQAR